MINLIQNQIKIIKALPSNLLNVPKLIFVSLFRSHFDTLFPLFSTNGRRLMINESISSLFPSNMTVHSKFAHILLTLGGIFHLFLLMKSAELIIVRSRLCIFLFLISKDFHIKVLSCLCLIWFRHLLS